MSAIISPCGTYRYLLKRQADPMSPMKSTVLFVMLSPSTAHATLDDPAVRWSVFTGDGQHTRLRPSMLDRSARVVRAIMSYASC
ncbi:DUF1643 domain-containing protein [Paraburkholderia hospita]|uniref:Secreted protein n=1 Tax=Paraburkholderia hospita TaxID=169430 RepID=A0ABN0FK96_9BURK|nr:DUF1643 domain-containing protein [Paraburkholderia hospita]EIM99213.1 hypothetical protein WQE_20226 [Paraburkholderia hospita]OUL72496.1 hypothetical protein CA602_43455 [Paraburkholderia hospita]OUL80704.1 hypothetical protein CA603_31365 [Paraburkholderia hospita]OUL94109.1 hypothetical protein CA601_09050 [Paraburkholderia hospita]